MPVDKTKIIPSQRYINGVYNIRYKKKYKGDTTKIIYRSSYERKFCVYCDTSDKVLSWSSEPFTIPYNCPLLGKKREYLIDFYARIQNERGEINDFLIEVKPKAKLRKPIPPKNQTLKKLQTYNTAMKEFLTNMAKFSAARLYAIKIGYKFIIVTEDILF